MRFSLDSSNTTSSTTTPTPITLMLMPATGITTAPRATGTFAKLLIAAGLLCFYRRELGIVVRGVVAGMRVVREKNRTSAGDEEQEQEQEQEEAEWQDCEDWDAGVQEQQQMEVEQEEEEKFTDYEPDEE